MSTFRSFRPVLFSKKKHVVGTLVGSHSPSVRLHRQCPFVAVVGELCETERDDAVQFVGDPAVLTVCALARVLRLRLFLHFPRPRAPAQ